MAVRDTLVNIIIKAKDLGSKQVQGFAGALNSLDNTVTRVAGALAAFFSVKLAVGFFKDAVTGAASFEEQMDKVEAVSGATAEEMAKLTEEAKRLGRETKFTATEAGAGLEVLARAGLSATDQIAALSPVLNVAQAEGIGLAEAAGYVTDTLSIYNLEAADSAKVSDLFAKGASIANTSISDLGQALRESGGLAKGSNLSLEQTVAILDQLANNGLRGSKAGVALKGILAQLADPASKARTELKKLGINTGELSTVIAGLEKAGDSGKAAMLAFGTEALPAIQALTNGGSEAIEGFTAKLKEAEGAAADMAKIATGNLKGALAGLGSAFDGIKQQLAAASLPVFTEQIKDLTTYFQNLASDGSAERFGASLAQMFKDSGARFKEWISSFDFSTAIDGIGEFVRDLTSSMAMIASTFNVGYQSVRIFTNGFASAIKSMVGVFAYFVGTVADGWSRLLQLFGADTMASWANETSKLMLSVADEAKQQIIQDGEDIANAWKSIQESLTGNSAAESAKRVKTAKDESVAIVKAAEDTGEALNKIHAGINLVGILGANVSQGLADDFTTALTEINNGADLEQFRTELKRAWSEGKISADQYVSAMGEAKKKTVELGQETDNAVGGNASSWKALADTMQEAREIREKARAEQDAGLETHAAEKEAIDGTITSYADFKAELGGADTRSKLIALRSALVNTFDAGKLSVEQFNESMTALDSKLDEVKKNTRSFAVTLAGEGAAAFSKMSEQMQAFSEKAFASIHGAGKTLSQSWWAAEHAMRGMLEQYKKQESEVERITAALTEADVVTESMLNRADQLAGEMNLLGAQQLAPLRNALDSARQKMASLKNEAGATLGNLRDELDSLNSNYQAIEDRSYQAQRAELMALIQEAQRSGASSALKDAQESMLLLDQIHTKKLASIKAETDERKRYDAEAQAQAAQSATQPRSDSGANTGSAAAKIYRVELSTGGGQSTGASFDSEAEVDRFLKLLRDAGLSSL